MHQPFVIGAPARTHPSLALRAASLALAIAFSVPPAFAQPARAGGERVAERELFKLENDWAQAVVKRDARAISRLVAPGWVYSDESGVMNRAEGIRSFTSGPDTVREASNSEMKAIVYPHAAAVIGILQMKGSGPNGPFTRRYRYTDAWARLGGRWQAIASQDYLMPEKAAP
jgi:ketosteroid isomerase-like protein